MNPCCSMWWAHPRSRGEHMAWSAPGRRFQGSSPLTRGALAPTQKGAFPGGSSPLTRGAHGLEVEILEHVGLIPAHAGSTEG